MLTKVPLTVDKLKRILNKLQDLDNASIYLSDLRPLTHVWITTNVSDDEFIVVLSDPEVR